MFKEPVRDGPRRMEGIQIYELKRMDLRGATVIDGFPSVGLVSSIVANYLINALNLTQIGIMDSIYFPTVALVRDGQPMNPVRIYAGSKVDDHDQIVVFISEFQPPPNLIKAIAATVLDWAQDARSAARAIEIIDKLLLHTELDARPLYEEAERIEMQLKSIHHQTEAAKKPTEPPRPSMYG